MTEKETVVHLTQVHNYSVVLKNNKMHQQNLKTKQNQRSNNKKYQ